VTYRLIGRQRLDKHIPAEANTRNNTTSIARQQISKQASTIESLFSAWSVPRCYKGTKEVVLVSCYRELGRVLEMTVQGD
jgi:hypothetical protein